MIKNIVLNANDVSELVGCAKSMAYQIMKQLNEEQQKKGNLVVRGRISIKYFAKRYYKGTEVMDMQKLYYTADDVKEMLKISKSQAYKHIKDLNDELKNQGYITVAGKVSKKYFLERMGVYENN